MNRSHFMSLRPLRVGVLVLVSVWFGVQSSRAKPDAQKDAEEARSSLRQQGFKTDLSDFTFYVDEQTAARASALTNFSRLRPLALLEPCGKECALVAWKQAKLEEVEEGYQNLPSIEETLAANEADLDLACAAAIAGPIRFPLRAQDGSAMLLPHLASLRNLAEGLAARVIVDLRERRDGAAWTNLLALTRLSTAWEPEPCEVSQLVRFQLSRTAWKATWQALQAHDWDAGQLTTLQHEWEAPDFFKGLPETAAFTRACRVDLCRRERQTPVPPGPSLKDTLKEAVESPSSVAAQLRYRTAQAQYRSVGTYEDEHDLLLFFRDREVELRKAIAAHTWLQMRALPGATNTGDFQSSHPSAMSARSRVQQVGRAFQLEGASLLGRAAETEARRRLVLAAIGLERYRVAHGAYPTDLQSLSPGILKGVPIDFMDGRPLRYRLSDGAFVLYSVGLDCVDDGGELASVRGRGAQEEDTLRPFTKLDPFDRPDVVWPRAASEAEVRALRNGQAQAKQERARKLQRQEEERARAAEQAHQATMARLAAIYAKGEVPKLPDPEVEGGRLSQVLRNKALAGPPLRLDQMLTLRPITRRDDPDIATFELPLSYEAVTNVGTLRLLCDADPSEELTDEEASAQEFQRGPNGNCRLMWNITYEPPGQHFLQAELSIERRRAASKRPARVPEELSLKGPLFSFVSTNAFQRFPMSEVYTEKGASFHVKLAQPVGSYSLKLTSPTGEVLHTFTGTTTNGIVDVQWDLTCDDGQRYTNNTLNSTWDVTFPEPGTSDRGVNSPPLPPAQGLISIGVPSDTTR